jgi:nicotinate-nucleotide pyrophosphorylase (carboxylating)
MDAALEQAYARLVPFEWLDAVIDAALAEDRGVGDITSEAAIGPEVRARARLRAKGPGRLAGLPVFLRVFERCDPECCIERLAADGDAVGPGMELVRVEGRARALLLAERTALNFVQRLSGVATATEALVRLADGRARILDTRKTTPGLRPLEKYAVRCGGGENHRFGLFDEAMVKENHIDLAGGDAESVGRRVREAIGPEVRLTVEARDDDEARGAVRGGADVVLLDNRTPEAIAALVPELRALARELGREVEFEASGGIHAGNLAAYAACGIDRISIGAVTHSAPSLDLSLELEPLR